MYIRRNIRWQIVLGFARRYIAVFLVYALLILLLDQWIDGLDLRLPFAPIGTIGVAVAFYIGFKNNQSYDRNWSARKIWGEIVNGSRSLAIQLFAFAASEEAEVVESRTAILYRHLAWVNALRVQLRRASVFGLKPKGPLKQFSAERPECNLADEISEYLSAEECESVLSNSNSAVALLKNQAEALAELKRSGEISDFQFCQMMEIVNELTAAQGKAERIKNTPFPRQYAYFSKIFLCIFIALMPFGLLSELARLGNTHLWIMVPLTVLISWIFTAMELVGDSSEDPFENFVNDVPLDAICRTIEIDLREMLGESEVPAPVQPVNDILM